MCDPGPNGRPGWPGDFNGFSVEELKAMKETNLKRPKADRWPVSVIRELNRIMVNKVFASIEPDSKIYYHGLERPPGD